MVEENTGQILENAYRNAVQKMAGSKLFFAGTIFVSVFTMIYCGISIITMVQIYFIPPKPTESVLLFIFKWVAGMECFSYIIPLIIFIVGLWMFFILARKKSRVLFKSLIIIKVSIIIYSIFYVYFLFSYMYPPFFKDGTGAFGIFWLDFYNFIPFPILIAIIIFVAISSIKKTAKYGIKKYLGLRFTGIILFITAAIYFCGAVASYFYLDVLDKALASMSFGLRFEIFNYVYNYFSFSVFYKFYCKMPICFPFYHQLPWYFGIILNTFLVPAMILFGIVLFRYKKELKKII